MSDPACLKGVQERSRDMLLPDNLCQDLWSPFSVEDLGTHDINPVVMIIYLCFEALKPGSKG